jgi:hypothetical protein
MRRGARKMSQKYFAGRDLSAASRTKEIARDVDLLMIKYGDEADVIAARRADRSFRTGDETAGHRWAQIFLILAGRHLSAYEQFENTQAVSAARI